MSRILSIAIFLGGFLDSVLAVAGTKIMTIPDCTLIKEAKAQGAMNPKLLLALAKIESSKNPRALNKPHYGLLQIKYDTAKMLGFRQKPQALLDWKVNLKVGSKYLNQKLVEYKSPKAAIAAYNAGAAYICKKGKSLDDGKPCRRGFYVNQKYVDRVWAVYQSKLSCSS
jgi:soluble lytic murein transglycosylase-like protein